MTEPARPDPLDLAREVAAVYADAEQRIVATIADRIERRGYEPEWAIANRDAVRTLRKQAAAILEQAAQQAPVGQAVSTAATAAASQVLAQLAALGAQTSTLAGAAAVQTLAAEAVGAVRSAQMRVLRDVEDEYKRITTRAAAGMLTGSQTRREATQTALNRLADEGLTAFEDSAGRSWPLQAYAEMTTRTIAAHARVQAQLDTLAAAGRDLVYVSDSPRECDLCRDWEAVVLSISGTSREHPSVAEATSAGLLHPNCTHALNLYLPGVTKLPEPTRAPESYDAKQQQRYYERQIRRWKRRRAAAVTPEARRKAERKIRQYQAAIRDHLAGHPELKRLPYREQNRAPQPEAPAVRGPHASEDRRGNPEHNQRATPAPVNITPPETDPLAGVDLAELPDDRIAELFQQYSANAAVVAALMAEMDRRDQQPAEPTEPTEPTEPSEAEQWAQAAEEASPLDEWLAQGYTVDEAIEAVYGDVEEEHTPMQAMVTGQGGSKKEQVRQAYYDWVETQFVAAEEATRGNLLNKAGQAAGVDPKSLFSGPASRARKYASEELKRWWQANPRMTLTEFRAQALGWASDKAAARKAREQGAGREFGL